MKKMKKKPKGMKNGGKAMKPKGMANGGKMMKPKGMKMGGKMMKLGKTLKNTSFL